MYFITIDKWYFRVSEVIAMSIVNKSLISLFWKDFNKAVSFGIVL